MKVMYYSIDESYVWLHLYNLFVYTYLNLYISLLTIQLKIFHTFFKDIPAFLTHLCPIFGLVMEALFTNALFAQTLLLTRKVIKTTNQDSTSKIEFHILGPTISNPEDLVQFLQRLDDGKYHCTICNEFSHKIITCAKNHVEAKHFNNSFIYNCPFCPSTFTNKKGLYNHRAKHK